MIPVIVMPCMFGAFFLFIGLACYCGIKQEKKIKETAYILDMTVDEVVAGILFNLEWKRPGGELALDMRVE